MPSIIYGKGSYKRDKGNFPPFTLVNMFLEATPTTETGVALTSRQGLMTSTTIGASPVTGVFSQAGTYNGDLFVVTGGNLYRAGALLGAVAGSGPVSFAASATEVLVTAGTTLYSYNGTNFLAVVFPDSANVRAIAFISGHFIAIRDGTQKFYWSGQLDGRSWDALDFASAETEPDNLLDAVSMRSNLYLMGQAAIEPWYYTGDLNLPFSLIQQRLFPKGVRFTGCTIEQDNALIWVGSDNIVYRSSDVPERISNHGIEEQIAASATALVFGYIYEGHSHVAVRLDTATYAIDFASNEWWEMRTSGRTNFAGRCATTQGTTVLFGDDASGIIKTFGTTYADNGLALLREFTGAFPIKGGVVQIDNLTVDANSGRTELLVGQGFDPMLEMAVSRDAGATWGAFRTAKLGRQGEFRTRSRWNRMGMFDAPGAMFKIRLTDPCGLRVSNVLVNEPGGGRSRG